MTTTAEPRSQRGTTAATVAFAVVLVTQFLALYWPRVAVDQPASLVDEGIHALLFAAPAAAGLLARLRPAYLLGPLALHAPVSELLQQELLPHRSGDPLDALADLVGVGLGAAVGVVWARLRRW